MLRRNGKAYSSGPSYISTANIYSPDLASLPPPDHAPLTQIDSLETEDCLSCWLHQQFICTKLSDTQDKAREYGKYSPLMLRAH